MNEAKLYGEIDAMGADTFIRPHKPKSRKEIPVEEFHKKQLLEWEVEALNQTSSWYRDQWKLERSKRRWAGATKLGSLLVIVACTFLVGYGLGKAGIWVAEFWTWFEFTVRSL